MACLRLARCLLLWGSSSGEIATARANFRSRIYWFWRVFGMDRAPKNFRHHCAQLELAWRERHHRRSVLHQISVLRLARNVWKFILVIGATILAGFAHFSPAINSLVPAGLSEIQRFSVLMLGRIYRAYPGDYDSDLPSSPSQFHQRSLQAITKIPSLWDRKSDQTDFIGTARSSATMIYGALPFRR